MSYNQSKRDSFVESTTNVLSGIILAIISYQLIMPMLGYNISFGDNLFITGYFTVLGLIRSYTVRRIWNRASL